MKPHARKDDLVIQEMGDELLVYDVQRDRAHSLNPVTALVWRSSDGKTTVAEIAAQLSARLDTEADEAIVWSALKCLEEAHLLREPISPAPDARRYSRRELMRRVAVQGGLTAVAFGIVSMAAPTPAEACFSRRPGRPRPWWPRRPRRPRR